MTKFYTSVERFMNDILYVGYENNRRVTKRVKFKPTLFVPTTKPTKYKTLEGTAVDKIQPGTMSECRQFIKEYYASNFQVCGNFDYIAQFLANEFPDGCIVDQSKLNVTFIDIEVASDQGFPEPAFAYHPVTAITIKNNVDDTFYTWAYNEFDPKKSIVKDKRIEYIRCKDEPELLMKFLDHWQRYTPDIITGWNSDGFDMPYLINRVVRLLGEDMTRKFSMFSLEPQARDNGSYHIPGSTHLDYLELFKKFTYVNQENYKLDNIANVILGEKKLDYSEYDSLATLYKENHQKFIDYNIRDTQIVERLDDKLGLISLALTLANKANAPLNTVFGSVKIWDTFIFNVMKKKNLVMTPTAPPRNDRGIEGAYVKDPQVGMHHWVCSFDLNSLYPHLIMQYNMSPETIVNEVYPGCSVNKMLDGMELNIPKDRTVTPTGQLFRTDKKGMFPDIVEKLYAERSQTKKKALDAKQELEHIDKSDKVKRYNQEKLIAHYDNEQMAIKIMMNSLYGAMSNKFFRYYDIRMAEAITISGQLSIRTAERAVNNYMNKILKTNKDYVLAIDTDSIYVVMEDLVKASGITSWDNEEDRNAVCMFLDKVAKMKFEPVIDKAYQELADYVRAFDQKMNMKREVIATDVIFTGKKRYIANVLNNEGVQYAKPKIKVTGIESVRSSTPQMCRKLIEKTMELIMNEGEAATQEFIARARDEFKKLRPEDVAFPRGVNNLHKEYGAGIGMPIHVRAARAYNKLLKDMGLENKYESIKDGEKIKFTYLKMPNMLGENVIGFPMVLPDEFELNSFIDYDTQFDKSYVDPIKHILDAIGWTVEKQNTLEDFFS